MPYCYFPGWIVATRKLRPVKPRFQPAGKYWFIDRRGEKKLRKWLDEVAGGDVIVREFDRERRLVTAA